MCESCLHINEKTPVKQYDPTHTLTLRNTFVRAMNKRFNKVAKLINTAVIDEDIFGLNVSDHSLQIFQTPGSKAFAFKTKDEKIKSFLQWLRQIEDTEILALNNSFQYGKWMQVPWFDLYLAHAYTQGSDRAKQEMKKHELSFAFTDDLTGTVFINPVALETLRVIFTRAYTDLQGITNSMDEQISRILAQGLFEGQSPIVLARMINSAVIGMGETLGMDISYINRAGKRVSYFMPGKRRAEILARTEIIRAHHLAMVQEYKSWGVQGVYVLAEWMTAGDDRVCPDCASLQGRIFTLEEIENLIPYHAQCRCIALPYVDRTRTKVEGM